MDVIGIVWAIFSLWVAHKLVEYLNTGEEEE
jgi:hypothetical protein